jgi:four helix bundle protein
MGARRHTDLEVWKLANELRERTLTLTAADGFARQSWLKEQLVRASQSACSNIAEGFGRYRPRDFARFLRITKGSLLEIEDHLRAAKRLGAASAAEIDELSTLIRRSVACATRLIRYLETANAP